MANQTGYILRCPACGARNRIPENKAGRTARCGKCHGSIDTAVLNESQPVTVTDATFEQAVLKSPLPVLLDCWAPWCGPCRMVGPIMDQLASEYRGRVRIGKLNVDENPQVAARFSIRSIPTMMIFDRGKLQHTAAGALPKQQILQQLQPYL